jgi:RNA polymerase sigma-70 factor, ECF subfamily
LVNPDLPNANADPDSSKLLEAMRAFQRGEEAGFNVLYESLWGPVGRRSVKMGLSAEESAEIAQKVLVRVYLYARSADFASEKKLWAWVYTVTAREVYKYWAMKRPTLVREEEIALLETQASPPELDPGELAAQTEAHRAVGECLGRLPEGERLPLVGTLLQGLTFRAAAALHGLSLGQFKHRYEAALRKVRECMRGKGFEIPDSQRTDGGVGGLGGQR